MLLVDLGNSRCKVAVSSEEGKCELVFAEAYAERSPVEVAALVAGVVRGARCVLASVRNENFTQVFVKELERLTGGRVELLAVPARGPLKLAYDTPEHFGLDRYLDLLGARALGFENALVIDAGTAVTFDVLSGDRHLGGCIFPGVGLLERSLYQGGDLIVGDARAAGELLASSTASGVRGGVLEGYLGALKQITGRVLSEMPVETSVVATGGDALLVRDALGSSIHMESHLLFAGMKTLALEP